MNAFAVKTLLIQGATGSVGRSTLDVVRRHPERFSVVGLSANSNIDELLKLAREFGVESVALGDATLEKRFRSEASSAGIRKVYTGSHAAAEQVNDSRFDLLINALMGGAGIEPTLTALQNGIPVALANKETLVAAGPLVMKAARDANVDVIPIDSEHSAIFQCLLGESRDFIRRLWLTSSGGPFFARDADSFIGVSVEEALNHPTWKMGPKITIDSATLFNKGLEVIEAERLFGISANLIEIVVHRQSIVHSMVEFVDGSIKAQLSKPDMRLPILYAMTYPERVYSEEVQTNLTTLQDLTFETVPLKKFPCLSHAYTALKKGGTAPAALSAADEIVVDAFLNHKVRFTDIADIIGEIITDWPDEELTNLQHVLDADARARIAAAEKVSLRISTPKGISY